MKWKSRRIPKNYAGKPKSAVEKNLLQIWLLETLIIFPFKEATWHIRKSQALEAAVSTWFLSSSGEAHEFSQAAEFQPVRVWTGCKGLLMYLMERQYFVKTEMSE